MSGWKRKIKKVVTQQESQASIGGRERLRHVNQPVYFLPIETVWFPLDGKGEGRKKTALDPTLAFLTVKISIQFGSVL